MPPVSSATNERQEKWDINDDSSLSIYSISDIMQDILYISIFIASKKKIKLHFTITINNDGDIK